MSQFADITKVFKHRVASGELDIDDAISLFIDVINALEWDLEEYMPNIPNIDTNPNAYQIAEHAAALKLLC